MKTMETLDPEPFKHLIMTVGELPASFVDSMTYYECLAWLVNYIQKNVVPAINNNADAIKAIQEWIETLDLQTYVNTKLDEMVEDGTMAELLSAYYLDFERDSANNVDFNENFKNITSETMVYENNFVRVYHIKNVSDIEVIATSGDNDHPETGATNVGALAKSNNSFDLFINGGAFDGNRKPYGYVIFNGENYIGDTVPTSWGYYACFDSNNNLFIEKQTDIASINELVNAGAVNAVLTFQALKINGLNEASSETTVAQRQIIAQKTDGSYLIIFTDGRYFNSEGLTYAQCTSLINQIDNTIQNAIALDGGGSVQTWYNKYSLIPNISTDHELGRPVPTAIGFKLGE